MRLLRESPGSREVMQRQGSRSPSPRTLLVFVLRALPLCRDGSSRSPSGCRWKSLSLRHDVGCCWLQWCRWCRAAPAPHFPTRFSHTTVACAFPPPAYQRLHLFLLPGLRWFRLQFLYSLPLAHPLCGQVVARNSFPFLPHCGELFLPYGTTLRHNPREERAQERSILKLLWPPTDRSQRGRARLSETQGGHATGAAPR